MIMAHEDTMQGYYRERAPVYDRVYAYPERQADLRWLEREIPALLSGRRVLQVAAGTGYWTQFSSADAQSLSAQPTAHPSRLLRCPTGTLVAL